MATYLSFCLIISLWSVFPVNSDRSPYVPQPVTYPGLLPIFTSTTEAAPRPEKPIVAKPPQKPAAAERPRPEDRPPKPPATSAPKPTTVKPNTDDEDLGDRFGEENSRPSCPTPQVPCFDCIVYISKTGRITRFVPAREDKQQYSLWPFIPAPFHPNVYYG